MKIIFMGTPTFALPSLEKLNARYELLSVFTKIDKVNARGNKIIYSPIKDFALANNLKIYQPENFKDNALIDEIRAMEPDLIVVVAYGKILPKEVLDIPKYGVINLHSSLLPRFRGAAPINAAIIHGDSKSGVSIMYVEEELDAGPVILQKETEISDEDTFLKIYETIIYDKTYENASCGEVVEYLKGKGPVVKTADASLIISSAKPENKKQISGVDLINGKFLKIGEKLC